MEDKLTKQQVTSHHDRAAFAVRIKFCADKVGNISTLAKKAGLSHPSVKAYAECESTPSLDSVFKLADAADVSVVWLATGEGSIESGGTTESDFAVLPLFAPTGEPHIIKGSSNFSYNKEWLVRAGFNLKDLATVIVANDTMEPTAHTGATAIVDRSKTTPVNGLFALSINDWIEVRRLHLLADGKIRVICDNDKYPAFDADKESLIIAGRVVAFVHLSRA